MQLSIIWFMTNYYRMYGKPRRGYYGLFVKCYLFAGALHKAANCRQPTCYST